MEAGACEGAEKSNVRKRRDSSHTRSLHIKYRRMSRIEKERMNSRGCSTAVPVISHPVLFSQFSNLKKIVGSSLDPFASEGKINFTAA